MKFSYLILVLFLLITVFFAYNQLTTKINKPITNSNATEVANKMKIVSGAFKNNQTIPTKYTCDGENVSPPLSFSDVSGNTKALALIMDDPDAPGGTWTHWTLWDIDPRTTKVEEKSIPKVAIEGTTSFGKSGYGGPCPPSGRHRYFFTLYALDQELDLKAETKVEDLQTAMQGHILATSQLIGLYSR